MLPSLGHCLKFDFVQFAAVQSFYIQICCTVLVINEERGELSSLQLLDYIMVNDSCIQIPTNTK